MRSLVNLGVRNFWVHVSVAAVASTAIDIGCHDRELLSKDVCIGYLHRVVGFDDSSSLACTFSPVHSPTVKITEDAANLAPP